MNRKMKIGFILAISILLLLLTAAKPLLCWTIGRDLQWHRCKGVFSTEFDALAPWEDPVIVPATATPVAYPTAAPTWTWEPMPYQSPTPTLEPYPALPTEMPHPYPWGGFEP